MKKTAKDYLKNMGHFSEQDRIFVINFAESYAAQQLKEHKVEIEKLRNDTERQTETMDLIKDSDLIQLLGSIIGRLNIIINSEK